LRFPTRAFAIVLCLAGVSGCKKGPKRTLPDLPDATQRPSQNTLDLPDATVFDTCWRYSGHAGQALTFYEPLVPGAKRSGESLDNGNMDHSGGLCRDGSVQPRDPTRPGVYILTVESSGETIVDVWESVPKQH
jgi:hypothetical protein